MALTNHFSYTDGRITNIKGKNSKTKQEKFLRSGIIFFFCSTFLIGLSSMINIIMYKTLSI